MNYLFFYRETTSIWVSVDVPAGQPPGYYEGLILITALKTDAELEHTICTVIYRYAT